MKLMSLMLVVFLGVFVPLFLGCGDLTAQEMPEVGNKVDEGVDEGKAGKDSNNGTSSEVSGTDSTEVGTTVTPHNGERQDGQVDPRGSEEDCNPADYYRNPLGVSFFSAKRISLTDGKLIWITDRISAVIIHIAEYNAQLNTVIPSTFRQIVVNGGRMSFDWRYQFTTLEALKDYYVVVNFYDHEWFQGWGECIRERGECACMWMRQTHTAQVTGTLIRAGFVRVPSDRGLISPVISGLRVETFTDGRILTVSWVASERVRSLISLCRTILDSAGNEVCNNFSPPFSFPSVQAQELFNSREQFVTIRPEDLLWYPTNGDLDGTFREDVWNFQMVGVKAVDVDGNATTVWAPIPPSNTP